MVTTADSSLIGAVINNISILDTISENFYKCNFQVWLLFSYSKTIATLAN